MGRFQYRALMPSGDVIEDIMEAPNRDSVIARLRDADQLPISVSPTGAEETTDEATPRPGHGHRTAAGLRQSGRGAERVSVEALAVFTRQLGTLLGARLSLHEALRVIADAGGSETIIAIAGDLRRRVREGTPLSDAMDAFPRVFDKFYRAMVRAGEGGGALEDSLGWIADYLEGASRFRDQVRSALIYPIFLLAAACVSVAILITVVLPQFDALFRSAAGDLPWVTRAVFTAAAFVREDGLYVVLGLAIIGTALWLKMRTATARHRWDGFILRLPLAGELVRIMEFERIFRSLAALIGNGVELSPALDLSAAVARNRVIAAAVNEANTRVREGDRLADAFGRQPIVPRLAQQLIRVGEESSELDAMLVKLADIYAQQLETALKRLVAVIEPALIVLIGLFVAVIIISLFSAIVGVNAIAF